MDRRHFFSSALTAVALQAAPSRRISKVEMVFQSPGPHPNGLQATAEGLWIIDQSNNKAHLVSYQDGKVLREIQTESDRPSGITHDGEALWLASTYDRLLIRADPKTGKTLSEHFTPGAGVIYRMTGDPAARKSPLPPQHPPPPAARKTEASKPEIPSQFTGVRNPGTGAHGLEWKDGKLWVAVPPSRTIYQIDPKTWTVLQKFPTAANRTHGVGWEGNWLWNADSNLNAFVKHDITTGKIVEKIQLADSDPQPHGITIWQGMMWYCDDVGIVCRFKL